MYYYTERMETPCRVAAVTAAAAECVITHVFDSALQKKSDWGLSVWLLSCRPSFHKQCSKIE